MIQSFATSLMKWQKKPLQIIGLTEYESEFSRQQQEFKDKLWYLLFYSRTSEDLKFAKP